MGVAAAARSLHVAGNTVSTLVNQLIEAGMLHRSVDPADRRAARLTLTDAARDRLARWRAARSLLVAEAVGRLSAHDVAALEAALPALKNLVRELEEQWTRLLCDASGCDRSSGRPSPSTAWTWRSTVGEVFGLLGPNGAGKTTTIRLITTLLPAPPGAIEVLGLDVARRRTAVRRLLGYVPQQLSADATLTGRENVSLYARLYDVPRRERAAQVQAVLEAVDLTEVADRPGQDLLRRHGPPPRAGAGAGQRAASVGTRRADGRPRPGGPRRRVGSHRRDPPRHRHDRARHDARHAGGGRALRPDRAHAPRPYPRARHAVRAEGRDRARRHAR